MMRIQQRSRSPQYYLEAGLAYAERGDFISAVGLLRQAGMLSPRDPAIISAYGRALARVGEYELARDALRRLRELGDMSADDWVVLGQVEARTGSFDEALGAYAGALTLDPDLPAALEGRARIRLHQGNIEAAVLAFADLADRAAAADRPEERARLLYWQAMSHLAADDCQQASPLIQEAFDATAPQDAALLAALARMRATCLDVGPEALNEAMAWSEQIYDARPGVESAVTLAMVLAAQGRFRDAVDVQAAAIFEALKSGELDRRSDLQANMRRYEAEQRAERPFPADDPRFRLN
jgi:cytochrome c-type biogenesis protein CcmH/NrfG